MTSLKKCPVGGGKFGSWISFSVLCDIAGSTVFHSFCDWKHKKLSKNCQVNSSLWHFLSSSVSYSEVWVPPPNIVETPATGKYLMWVCHCEDNWKNFTPIHSMPSIWTEKKIGGRVRELIIQAELESSKNSKPMDWIFAGWKSICRRSRICTHLYWHGFTK